MQNIISQIEQAAGGSIPEEVRLLKQHRKTLDDIIKFTLGINNLQKSLESILLLKKPATDIPRDILSVLGNISDSVENLPSTELEKRLKRVEETLQSDITTIMSLSQQFEDLDPGKSTDEKSGETSEKLHALVSDFRRRTNTAIILKLHLRKRGVVVTESVISVTPDALLSQVTKLVIEEKKCRERTKNEFTNMNNELSKIIDDNQQSDIIKQYALTLREKINENIEHLNKGKDMEKMPFVIDIIELGVSKTDHSIPKKQTKVEPKQNKKQAVKIEKSKPGVIKKMGQWLSAPWSVKWKDIE